MQEKSEGQEENTAALLLGKSKAWTDLLSLKDERREKNIMGPVIKFSKTKEGDNVLKIQKNALC